VADRGTGAWAGWCLDELRNFTTGDAGEGYMTHNANAGRCRDVPNAPDRGAAPPTWESNRVYMSCELNFPETWTGPAFLPGQHLFGFGASPYRQADGQTSPFGIRVDARPNAFPDGLNRGFAQGIGFTVYERKDGVSHEFNIYPGTVAGIFEPGVWKRLEVEATYDPLAGRISGYVRYGETITRTFTANCQAGIPMKLGSVIYWGNLDTRAGSVGIRNLRYQ
jgi:hypothetical protein